MTLRAAAAALNVAPATAHRWWHRRQAASAEELRSGAWVRDRSSRPHHQPRRLTVDQEEPILRARRETGLGPGRLAGLLRRARSTIWKVLYRHGLSRRPRAPRESYRRYEWSRPGALLHVDTARLPRFMSPGHRAVGRTAESRRGRPELGYLYLHGCVDDHSRYAYLEQHPDERAETVAAFMRRAIEHFAPTSFARSSSASALARSIPRPTRHAGTARSSASFRRSSESGLTPTPGRAQPTARGHWHPSFATTTADGPTPHWGTGQFSEAPCSRSKLPFMRPPHGATAASERAAIQNPREL